jgi:hypothetical protein
MMARKGSSEEQLIQALQQVETGATVAEAGRSQRVTVRGVAARGAGSVAAVAPRPRAS